MRQVRNLQRPFPLFLENTNNPRDSKASGSGQKTTMRRALWELLATNMLDESGEK